MVGIDVLMEGNAALNETLSHFMRPFVSRTTLESDGHSRSCFTGIQHMTHLTGSVLNMLEILPPNIDTSGRKKYPVLIRV